MANTNLQAAKTAKKDEFYTQLTDIEKELRHYKEHFRDKVVLCNCDDPRVSNFVRYFVLNFEHLGLKRLISTCYKHQDIDLFGDHSEEKAVYLIYEGGKDDNGAPDFNKLDVLPLKGDGDFRSQECIELLKQADIVVTNPPFSLFREYVAQLMKYEKKFLIIGPQNAIKYKEIFPLLKSNNIWLGYNNGSKTYLVPNDYENNTFIENNKKYTKLGNTIWFTNLETSKLYEELILYKSYTPESNPKYENYDAIHVDKVAAIPCDYNGIMGVPISFLDKYCHNQFEIIGIAEGDSGKELGLRPYNRELKKLNPSLRDGQLFYIDKNGYPQKPFTRILIRRKQQ